MGESLYIPVSSISRPRSFICAPRVVRTVVSSRARARVCHIAQTRNPKKTSTSGPRGGLLRGVRMRKGLGFHHERTQTRRRMTEFERVYVKCRFSSMTKQTLHRPYVCEKLARNTQPSARTWQKSPFRVAQFAPSALSHAVWSFEQVQQRT